MRTDLLTYSNIQSESRWIPWDFEISLVFRCGHKILLFFSIFFCDFFSHSQALLFSLVDVRFLKVIPDVNEGGVEQFCKCEGICKCGEILACQSLCSSCGQQYQCDCISSGCNPKFKKCYFIAPLRSARDQWEWNNEFVSRLQRVRQANAQKAKQNEEDWDADEVDWEIIDAVLLGSPTPLLADIPPNERVGTVIQEVHRSNPLRWIVEGDAVDECDNIVFAHSPFPSPKFSSFTEYYEKQYPHIQPLLHRDPLKLANTPMVKVSRLNSKKGRDSAIQHHNRTIFLLPHLSYVDPIPIAFFYYCRRIASVLYNMEHEERLHAFSHRMANNHLDIPFDTIGCALTFSQEERPINLKVLAFLGDSLLRLFVTTLQCFEYPSLSVFMLNCKRGLIISNEFLANLSVKFGLPKYALRCSYYRKGYVPPLCMDERDTTFGDGSILSLKG